MSNKTYNSAKTGVEFSPWTDTGKFRVVSLHITEKLGGAVPKGNMSLLFVGDKKDDISGEMIYSQNTGTVNIIDEKKYPDSLKYKFNVFITHRNFYGNSIELEFVITDDIEFFTKRVSVYHYKSIPLQDKIKSLFPGKVDFRSTSPDVPDITVYQNCETNYEILTRLCYAYKANSIFCYSWDGLIIKDMVGLQDHLGNTEPVLELDIGRLTNLVEPYNLNYDKLQNHDAFTPWSKPDECTTSNDYSSFDSKYFTVQMDYQKYNVVEKEHEPYMMNTWLNTRNMNYPGNTCLKLVSPSMPHFKIGDALKNVDEAKTWIKIPWKKFVVYSNEFFFSVDANDTLDENGFKFSWTSYFYGIDKSPFNEQA